MSEYGIIDTSGGVTFKFRVPNISEQAVYFTVTDEPAFFVNSKDMPSFQWLTALMISWSRQIKEGVPPAVVIEDMLGVFDPTGRSWIDCESGSYQANSVVAHLGQCIANYYKLKLSTEEIKCS